MRLRPVLVGLTLSCSLNLAGCKTSNSDKRTSERPSASASPAEQAASAASSSEQPERAAGATGRAQLSEQQAQATLEAWLKAQNQGDFAAYQQLYAEKFTGTKLAGKKKTDFGREGWLKDRSSMFKKPFLVSAKNVQIHVSDNFAVVRFTQTWKSDTYQDSGDKELYLLHEAGQTLITRELMLSSDRGQANPAWEAPFDAGSVMLDDALLLPHAVDLNWATEHPHYRSDNLADRPVLSSALPAQLRKYLDMSFEIFDKRGTRCEMRPSHFKILVNVVPHFGVLNYWNDLPAQLDGRPAQTVGPQERALDLWQLAQMRPEAGLRLGLQFKSTAECPDPVWGRTLLPQKSPAWKLRAASADEQKLLLAASPKHPAVVQLNKETGYGRDPLAEPWWTGDALKRAMALEGPDGQLMYVGRAGGRGGCGYGMPETVHLLWRKQQGKLVPLPALFLNIHVAEEIVGVADLNGDLEPEIITDNGIYFKDEEAYEKSVDFAPLYMDCPC